MRKSQVSIEFMILIGFVFMIFLLFFIFIQDKRIDLHKEHHFKVLQEIGGVVSSEIHLALSVGDNYVRRFTLPYVALGKKYTFTYIPGENASKLSLMYADSAFGLEELVPVPKGVIIGNISPGPNIIYKKAGIVVINNSMPG